MSSTTNTPYMVKSMNSVISISDGAGVTIENGVITAPTIDLTNLNIDEIQGTAPINNIDLYTNSLGSIDLGSATTAIVNINATDTNILAANSLYMNSGTTTSILASTINLVSNEIVVGGGQNIYQNDLSQDFTIGGNATTRNFYLGNLTVPPQVPFTATTGFDVVNYDTCVALIGGGGTGQLYADDIYTFTAGAFSSLWSDNTAGIAIGANSILNSAAQSMGINNGTLALGTITNRTADTFIATGESHSGNIYLGSGRNSTGDIFIASNNYIGSSGVTTGRVYIGGASTSTRFNGIINIAAFLPTGGTNNVNIGSSSTVNTQQGSTLNLNSTNATNNVVTIGSSNTTSATHLATTININSTNASTNTLNIGSAQTTVTHKASTIELNSTNASTNIINIGNTTSTINLGSSIATVINSYPIKPVSASIAYSASTGTNIVGTIGYIQQGSLVNTTAPLVSGTIYTFGSMTITTAGVYLIQCVFGYRVTATANIVQIEGWIVGASANSLYTGQAGGAGATVSNYRLGLSGTACFATVPVTITQRFFIDFTSGAVGQNNTQWFFTATRIA